MLSDGGLVSCNDKLTQFASDTCLHHYLVKLPNTFKATSVVLQSTIRDHFPISLNIISLLIPLHEYLR